MKYYKLRHVQHCKSIGLYAICHSGHKMIIYICNWVFTDMYQTQARPQGGGGGWELPPPPSGNFVSAKGGNNNKCALTPLPPLKKSCVRH